ncbi:MAG TPA: type II secretion system protein [Verrucomicrobiae bacterium]
MNCSHRAARPSTCQPTERRAFTLIELLTVIAIVGVLAAILLPALSRARDRSQGMFCLNNTRQLLLAWVLYADDHESRLPYNLQMNRSSARNPLNWVNNVMSWELDSDNTNLTTITGASLGPYVVGMTSIYRCPSDRALSQRQMEAGWTQRIRSYSMNSMVGDDGSTNGVSTNNPAYKQFLKMEQIPHPADIFVFLDEHPDSIDDGSFANRDTPAAAGLYSVTLNEWSNLPGSYHNRSAAFSFADGHASLHHWSRPTTVAPPAAYAAHLPIPVPAASAENADFDWVIGHMSVER